MENKYILDKIIKEFDEENIEVTIDEVLKKYLLPMSTYEDENFEDTGKKALIDTCIQYDLSKMRFRYCVEAFLDEENYFIKSSWYDIDDDDTGILEYDGAFELGNDMIRKYLGIE